MSRNGVLLPIPPGSQLEAEVQRLVEAWPHFAMDAGYPRSRWLAVTEAVLGDAYPQSSSADRNITARSLAPFPLAQPATQLNRR